MQAAEIRVTGRVQGVGFRYFTMNAAMPLQLKGWVKNMPDGSVLIRAAGSEAAMTSFREAVRQGPSFGRVDQMEEKALSAEEAAALVPFQVTY